MPERVRTSTMSDPDAQRAAEFLATHAVLLLGVGLLAAVASVVTIIIVVRIAARFQGSLLRGFTSAVKYARRFGVLDRLVARAGGLIPGAYLGMHLTLGLLLTVIVIMFVALAEEALAGGEMAGFDVAFARALQKQR